MTKENQNKIENYYQGILEGNQVLLSQAITLIESTKKEHQQMADALLEKCLSQKCRSIRIGITGTPGVGKSTFINAFGLEILKHKKNLAVLAIDPSSQLTKGSILGDKTRMVDLSAHPHAFIRPTPSSGTLGGIAKKTFETIILCEAAGFETILIETVGVGQSEVTVRNMVDFFVLLTIYNAGDELQGIKRGVMEMADLLLVNKADGENVKHAQVYKRMLENALHFYPPKPSGWSAKVEICSAVSKMNLDEVWNIITDYMEHSQKNMYFEKNRANQYEKILNHVIEERLVEEFFENEKIQAKMQELKSQNTGYKINSYAAAQMLLDYYKTIQ